ncbi:MAG: peptide-methionine (R)-S-oxide reductase MsrB [Ignavibacteria bacterium]
MAIITAGLIILSGCGKKETVNITTMKDTMKKSEGNESKQMDSSQMPDSLSSFDKATFAGGCYWCMDASFEKLSGLKDVISGFAEGIGPNSDTTGKVEAIQVFYDPKIISYSELVDYYWKQFDPTDTGGSFHDRGYEYKSYIYYTDSTQKNLAESSMNRLEGINIFKKPIATKIVKLTSFTPVVESEQHFYLKDEQRYHEYREASGRDNYIKSIWGNIGTDQYKKPSEKEINKKLTPDQILITQKNGTDTPFSNAYFDNHKGGIYVDVVSGEPLFCSLDKFDSGTGWPAFTKPIDARYVTRNVDNSGGMERGEVRSTVADSHLGHEFYDGPAPTNIRYCINSGAMKFIPKENLSKEGYDDFNYLFK